MRLGLCSAASFIIAVILTSHQAAPAFAQAKITTTGRISRPATPPEVKPADEIAPQPVNRDEGKAESSRTDGIDLQAPTNEVGGLNLVCMGGGSANKPTVGNLNAWNSNGDFASATITGQRSQSFADQVRIQLDDDDPRLRMPRSMLPGIRGGKDGWFKLKNIEYGEGEITASIAVNVLNNPKLRLDRYTGAISISGKAGDYTGQCQKFDPDAVRKAF